jgi:4-carboxymuconolactone decarboxylase
VTSESTRSGRLTWLEPADLTAAQRETYDRIVGSRNRIANRPSAIADELGRLRGPFNAMLFSPLVGGALQEVGQALRTRGVLPARLRETAILQLARVRRCSFEWYAHEGLAREAGLTDEELGAIRTGTYTPALPTGDRLVRTLVETLLSERDLSDASLEEAVSRLGEDGLCELIILVGYYDLLALSLQVWRTPSPDGTAVG